MIEELDTVVLTRDVPEKGLLAGDVGSVVHVHQQGEAFEVEFVTAQGKTVALLTLPASDVRPQREREIMHVREWAERLSA